MSGRFNLFRQLQLGPAKPLDRLDVPCLILERQVCLQNDHVLRPADRHGFSHHIGAAFIGAVKLPHPPQVPGREPRCVRVYALQVFRSGHSRAFFWSGADQSAYLIIQFHLCQTCCHQRVQHCKQGGVINRLPDVHGRSPFRHWVPDFFAGQREMRETAPALLFALP